MNKENKLVENHDVLGDLTHELDANFGVLSVRLETLKNINIELGHVSEDVENTDTQDLTAMGLCFRDINHKILLLADLLRYTVNDLNEVQEQANSIKEKYFDFVRVENK